MQRSSLPTDHIISPQLLSDRWEDLCNEFLPLVPENTIWRHSRYPASDDPYQGWKIHISATVLTAADVLNKIGQFLRSNNIYFKAPTTLEKVMQLNSGIFSAYSQVGKIFTIYPGDESEFLSLVPRLARKLYDIPRGPIVPYDYRYKDSCVYYRYGAFRRRADSGTDSGQLPKILTPEGLEVPDDRTLQTSSPSWIQDPFTSSERETNPRSKILNPNYLILQSISQRGKGGVYKCVDVRENPPKPCILKEGRRNGELLWDGRDGRDRISNEGEVLKYLAAKGIRVPRVVDRFQAGENQYLVLEQIEGIDLQRLVDKSVAAISRLDKIKLSTQMCHLLAAIHEAGIIWRDCKLNNFLVDVDETVRPIDFEGACSESESRDFPWCTPLYMAREIAAVGRTKVDFNRSHDLFALGVSLFYLWKGYYPTAPRKKGPSVRSTRMPRSVRALIQSLLDKEPVKRPQARTIADGFGSLRDSKAHNGSCIDVAN